MKAVQFFGVLLLACTIGSCNGSSGGSSGGGGGTTPSAPSVSGESASQYSAGVVDFSATVNANGQSIGVRFEYGIGAYTNQTPATGLSGSTDTVVTHQVTGLTEGATYQYRCVAYGLADTYGSMQTTTVELSDIPGVTTGGASLNIGIVLTAFVNPKGSPADYQFYYYLVNKTTSVPTAGSYTPLTPVVVTNTYYDTYEVTYEVTSLPYTIGPTGTHYVYYQAWAVNDDGVNGGVTLSY